MAKPRIFISSTFYDLRQVRADLDFFIEQMGYDAVRNEEGDIPYGKDEALEEYCYKEIKNIDILVCIIGGRFGTESKRDKTSITQTELKTAVEEGKQVYVFIENNVLSEFETYLLNKESKVQYRYVDDVRVYSFIEEIKSLGANNTIKGFETATDITAFLREQLAGLFQRFLEQQIRIKEISLIRSLEKTAQNLNQLVNYLSDENKDQAEEINRILMINHPLIEDIKSFLGIQYNVYVEGFQDLNTLIKSRGYNLYDDTWGTTNPGFYEWIRETPRKSFSLIVSQDIFDADEKLRFIRKSDWNSEWVQRIEREKPQADDDDIPF